MNLLLRLTALLVLNFAVASMAHTAGTTTVSEVGHKAMAPEIAVSADGAINLVWIERTPEGEQIAAEGAASAEGHTHRAEADLWFARSTDGGATFTVPLRINSEQGTIWGFQVSKPRVLASPDGAIHIFYPGNAMAPKLNKPIVLPMYARSSDKGRSFSTPVALGPVPPSDNSDIVSGGLANAECFGTMTVDERGGVFAYWIDTRNMSKDSPNGKIFSAVSEDNGRTFSRDFEIFPADVCPCCQITATAADGRIYLGSRQVSAEGERDSTIAISTDRGRSFQPRVRWGGATWMIEGCPLKPTALAVSGENIYAASFNGGADPQGAYFSRSTDGGKTFSPALPLHPGAAVSDAPVIALLDGRIVVAWQAKTDAGRNIYLAVSRDGGATFAPPAELPASPGVSVAPVLAVRAGGVQIAWQQDDAIMTRYLPGDDPLLSPPAAAVR